MEELYRIGISENTIKNMLELVPTISEMSEKEIKEKELILKKINCDENQIIDIISSNPMCLDKTNDIVLRLISKLKSYGFSMLNILFDSNPYILNLEVFEIENYINNRLDSGEELEDIIDDLDSNPILFNEI
ncbi:unknown [Clostridium sp. CAG:433]|nr:unknown [Clostridium sp. CAG:433]